MNCYGIAWDGAEPPDKLLAENGARYHIFDSREGRDAWVRNLAEAESYGEHREALPSSNANLRRYLRDEREYFDYLYWHYKDEE